MKKLLLIIPKFFGYEKYILEEAQKLGYDVDFIFENIEELYYKYRFIARHFPDKRETAFDDYYEKKLVNKAYDVVLVIRGSSLSEKIIDKIKAKSPDARFYMYQWDSVKNNENARIIAHLFDGVATFDIKDAKEFGWRYRPLFYISASARDNARRYDIVYICSLHSQRLRIYQAIKENFKNMSIFLYMFSNRSHYYNQKYIKRRPEFSGLNDKEVKHKPLSLEDVHRCMGESDIVVDYTHPDQTGFTMRTCEAIGHRCKLITNNKLVKQADFYNENNVYVYDPNSIQIPESFIKSPYQEIPKKIFDRYSISTWLKELIDYEHDK